MVLNEEKRRKIMNKTKSFVYGAAVGLLGLVVAVLLYFLYFKKQDVKSGYYWIGVFLLQITILSIVGTFALFGVMNSLLTPNPATIIGTSLL